MDAKKEQIERLEKFILEELNHIATPMELKLEKLLNEEGIENDIQKDRLTKASVLWNIYKVLVNYDELEPTLKKFFDNKAKKMRFWEEDREL